MERLPPRTILNRAASGLIALALVTWGFVQGLGIGLVALAVYSGFCSLIWYGDELGSLRWSSYLFLANGQKSNGRIIAAVGWFLLVGFPIVMLYALKGWRP